jgi:hypothetical protein
MQQVRGREVFIMKRAVKIVGVLIVVLVLVVVGGVFWIDSIAKVGVETGATYALGVKTTVGEMDIGLFSGEAGMSKLNVRNPEGFDAPHFLELGNGNVAVSLGSLMEDTVVIPELTLSALSMNLERKGTKANYGVILNELKKFESKEGAEPAKPKERTEAEGGKGFVVKHVAIDDVTVQVDLLPVGGEATRVPLRIDRIELKDVGSGSAGGVQLGELTGIIMKAVLTSVVDKGGNLIPADIADELAKGLEGLGGLGDVTVQVVGDVTKVVDEQIGQLGQGAQEVGEKIEEGLKDAGKKLEEGIGGLLKKKEGKKDP